MIPLPLNGTEIFVEWRQEECGLGITAFTDKAGLAYIGLYPLDFEGYPAGLPTYFLRKRLMADVVVGFGWSKPLTIFIDAEVSARGLDVRLCIPTNLARQDSKRHLWATWGGPAPKFGACPANSNWRINPFPKDDESTFD